MIVNMIFNIVYDFNSNMKFSHEKVYVFFFFFFLLIFKNESIHNFESIQFN